MIELEALRHLPKALLTKLFDTSCALAKDLVTQHQQIDHEIRDPSQIVRKELLLHRINREAIWQARIQDALRERRPALRRVLLDGSLDD